MLLCKPCGKIFLSEQNTSFAEVNVRIYTCPECCNHLVHIRPHRSEDVTKLDSLYSLFSPYGNILCLTLSLLSGEDLMMVYNKLEVVK